MSFNRIKYDNEAYDLKMERSTIPGDYRLFMGNNENCEKCFSYDGPRNAKTDVSLNSNANNQWPDITEVESHITNRVNKLIDFNNYGKNDSYKKFNIVNKKVCKDTLIPQDTRFTNPIEAYRGMDLTAYHYNPFLYVNSQCEILEDRIGLNSRNHVKDTFVVTRPVPVDQTGFLPNENNTPGINVNTIDNTSNTIDVCKH
jgi:hypothetical protein